MADYPRDKMARIQQRLTNQTEAIRASRLYTDTGKRIEMAKLVKQARRERDQLKQAFLTERQTRRETLQRRLFGITGDATPEQLMIMRDSRDRAAKLDGPEDAATHLALATTSGDTYLAQAIAMVAANRGWNDVINTYAETAPTGTRTALEELADIPSGTRTGVADQAVFRLREPDELHAYRNDTDLDTLAAQDTQPPPPEDSTSKASPWPNQATAWQRATGVRLRTHAAAPDGRRLGEELMAPTPRRHNPRKDTR